MKKFFLTITRNKDILYGKNFISKAVNGSCPKKND